MRRLVFGSAVASTVFGVLWTAIVPPLQWICGTYVPPIQSLLSCPEVNFVYRWLGIPFLFVGATVLTYWASQRSRRFSTIGVGRRASLSLGTGAALAVIAAVLVWSLEGGVSYVGLTTGSPTTVAVSGVILIDSQSGAGTLTLAVKDYGNTPIFTLALAEIAPSLPIAPASLNYNGAAVTSSNPLPVGGSAYGQFRFASGGVSGTGYKVVISATFSNGAIMTSSATITASTQQST
jgi:hypothetical protein